MRFKKKRDDVKALHATMKELQGIDPLDYLARCVLIAINFFNGVSMSHNHRYCIIDQAKLPHYQHAYDNVDRDEDDEIDIAELDFALKAVNYDLISDAEMTYVHLVTMLLFLWFQSLICNQPIDSGAGWKVQTELQTLLTYSSSFRKSGRIRVSCD